MRVFVLSTGRCGSLTFAQACSHITNYTSGHETRAKRLHDRLDYPDDHIEVDNRLSWFLGPLGHRYGDEPLYIHLTRDRSAVVESFMRRMFDMREPKDRWKTTLSRLRRGRIGDGIIGAFGHGVITRTALYTADDAREVAGMYVDTVNANIDYFLRDKPHAMAIDLADGRKRFAEFWDRIGAAGPLDAAVSEFGTFHNASGSAAG